MLKVCYHIYVVILLCTFCNVPQRIFCWDYRAKAIHTDEGWPGLRRPSRTSACQSPLISVANRFHCYNSGCSNRRGLIQIEVIIGNYAAGALFKLCVSHVTKHAQRASCSSRTLHNAAIITDSSKTPKVHYGNTLCFRSDRIFSLSSVLFRFSGFILLPKTFIFDCTFISLIAYNVAIYIRHISVYARAAPQFKRFLIPLVFSRPFRSIGLQKIIESRIITF